MSNLKGGTVKDVPQIIAMLVGWALLVIALAFSIPQPFCGVLMLVALICFGFSAGWSSSNAKGGE